jgi:hypothetical protein
VDEQEAREVLKPIVTEFRARSYAELREVTLDHPEVRDVVGPSGTRYQVEIGSVLDDAKHNRNLRVFFSIDDGRGWRAIAPLSDAFIMSPEGDFIDEA